MRLFVALVPPPAVLGGLEAAVAPLRARRPDLRWTSQDGWHITLAFLGEADETATARLTPELAQAASRHRPFGVTFAGAGAFPAAARARVLWCGLRGGHRDLAGLAASAAAAAHRAGAPPPDEGRVFRPHLTLARCRAAADVGGLVEALRGYEGPGWMADRIHLIHSRTGGQPRYLTVASWPLRGDRLGA